MSFQNVSVLNKIWCPGLGTECVWNATKGALDGEGCDAALQCFDDAYDRDKRGIKYSFAGIAPWTTATPFVEAMLQGERTAWGSTAKVFVPPAPATYQNFKESLVECGRKN